MMVIQNVLKVYVCDRPRSGSMVVAAGQHPPMFFLCVLVPALI